MELAINTKKLPESICIGDDSISQNHDDRPSFNGGFGKVYKALMKNLPRIVAIKVPKKRFREKAKVRTLYFVVVYFNRQLTIETKRSQIFEKFLSGIMLSMSIYWLS